MAKEEKDLEMFEDLLDDPGTQVVEDDNTPKPLDPTDDPILNDYVNGSTGEDDTPDPSEDENNESHDSGDFLHNFLKEKGIEDPSKLQWEDENGEITDVDFDSLSDEDKLNVLNSLSDPGLSQHEIDVVNYLRQNGVTFNQVIDYFSKKAVDDYIAQNPDSVPTKTYTIDDYTDEELYLADLKSKYPDFTDEELTSKLNSAKSNEELFKKEVNALRTEYKNEEDAQVEAQKQKEQQDYDNLVNNLQNILGNFNEVVLDSTDPESDVLEIEDSDKEQVLAYLLNQDTDGKSQLVKDLENPTTLIELAWLRTQGRALIDNSTRYWKDLLKQERKEKAKLEKELESYRTRESQSVVVPKPPKSNNSNEKDIPTFGSVWDNNII